MRSFEIIFLFSRTSGGVLFFAILGCPVRVLSEANRQVLSSPRKPPLADILRESSPGILLTEVCLVRELIGIRYEITS